MKEIHIKLSFNHEDFESDAAEIASYILPPDLMKSLRNEISARMKHIADLKLVTGKEQEYAQEVAGLRGEITAFGLLLDLHQQAIMSDKAYHSEGPLGPITKLDNY